MPPDEASPSGATSHEVVDTLTGRAAIDRVDAQIRDLVRQRQVLSVQVQEFRAEDGHPEVQHGRENDIVRSYADALGRPGTRIALELLALCRG